MKAWLITCAFSSAALWAQGQAPTLTDAEKKFQATMENLTLAGYYTFGDSTDLKADQHLRRVLLASLAVFASTQPARNRWVGFLRLQRPFGFGHRDQGRIELHERFVYGAVLGMARLAA